MLVCIYYHRIGQVEIVARTSSSSDTLNQHMIRCLFCNCQFMKREACYLVKHHLTAIWHQRRKTIATVKGQPDLPYTAHRCHPHLDVKTASKEQTYTSMCHLGSSSLFNLWCICTHEHHLCNVKDCKTLQKYLLLVIAAIDNEVHILVIYT